METGLTYSSTVQVNSTNTALALGSGDMEVFATPALVALMENAAMNAVKPVLPEGSTTVGAMIQTSHLNPSGPERRSDRYRGTHRNRRTETYLQS